MFEIFGVPSTAFFGQLLLGLINGSFYALLSIGLAVIFGLLNIINFAHGAQYTAGAFLAWMLLNYVGVNWAALVLVPLIMAVFAVVTERLLISRTYRMDHLYGLLLTFGIALLIEADCGRPMAYRACRTPSPRRCPAASTWASCSCPGIAAGPCWCRWRCACWSGR